MFRIVFMQLFFYHEQKKTNFIDENYDNAMHEQSHIHTDIHTYTMDIVYKP